LYKFVIILILFIGNSNSNISRYVIIIFLPSVSIIPRDMKIKLHYAKKLERPLVLLLGKAVM